MTTSTNLFRPALILALLIGLAVPVALARKGRAAGGNTPAVAPALDAMPVSTLSQEELEGIAWMREEEKLARDVYQVLGALYDLPVFETIAASEQTHMDAIAVLLDRYGIEDPAAGMAPGEFADPQLQELYDSLLAQGRTSREAALEVAVTIEEVDILDLRARASEAQDVAFVYGALERGSENHLRAFTRLYEGIAGATYQPQFLQAADYARIVSGRRTAL